ncbi:MAG: hypothetical protein AB7T49_03660 [Oligoflexales bacterium]
MKTTLTLLILSFSTLSYGAAFIEAKALKYTEITNPSIQEQGEIQENSAVITLAFNHQSGNSCETFVGFEQNAPRNNVPQYRALKTVGSIGESCAQIATQESASGKIALIFVRDVANVDVGGWRITFKIVNDVITISSIRESCGICGR